MTVNSFRFLVRAENSHGMSPPSSMTDRVRTLRAPRLSSSAEAGVVGSSSSEVVDLDALHDVLLNKVVELTSIEAIGSTKIR